jgi:phosphoesterase RecJ-like protein
MSIAALFMEHKDGIKISFRSKGNYFVNEFAAKHFEGGCLCWKRKIS